MYLLLYQFHDGLVIILQSCSKYTNKIQLQNTSFVQHNNHITLYVRNSLLITVKDEIPNISQSFQIIYTINTS